MASLFPAAWKVLGATASSMRKSDSVSECLIGASRIVQGVSMDRKTLCLCMVKLGQGPRPLIAGEQRTNTVGFGAQRLQIHLAGRPGESLCKGPRKALFRSLPSLPSFFDSGPLGAAFEAERRWKP